MNFFEHQDRAHQNTQKLVGLFIMAVLCIIFAVYLAALFAFTAVSQNYTRLNIWQPELFVLIALPTILVIGGGSLYKLAQLRQGGSVIAQELGGRLLTVTTPDSAERQLLNVVEEMAIAAGISVPAVYVLDQEASINAFAAGFTPNDAVIGVTKGCLEQLTRDELQGVIGHEFSHILNGDMRLNLRMVGVLYGILLIYIVGRGIFDLRYGLRSRDNDGKAIFLFGLALILIGSIGAVFGRLIQSAISRQREFLADASAVQFTRNPSGIAAALRKIASYHHQAFIQSPQAAASSHLFFGNALRANFLGELFATHPPLNQRIRRLEASIGQAVGQSVATAPSSSVAIASEPGAAVMGLAPSTLKRSAPSPQIHAKPKQVIAQVGTVSPEHFAYAQALLAQLPTAIQTGLRDSQSAVALVYGLAIETEPPTLRDQQLVWLGQVESSEMLASVREFQATIAQLDPRMRLPLLDLTIPALRQNPASQAERMLKVLQGLAKVDGRWSLSEFVVYVVLRHRLHPDVAAKTKPQVQYTTLPQVWADCLMLLSSLSRVGQTQPDAIAYAFRSGLYRLPGISQLELPEFPPASKLAELQKSLQRLSNASPKLKQAIIDACAHTVLLDNLVTVPEADLLRAIIICLDCPLPPFLNSTR